VVLGIDEKSRVTSTALHTTSRTAGQGWYERFIQDYGRHGADTVIANGGAPTVDVIALCYIVSALGFAPMGNPSSQRDGTGPEGTTTTLGLVTLASEAGH